MTAPPDHKKLYRIAESQAGYFTARQARSAGFTPSLLSYHVRAGRFLRIRRGIYRLAEFPEMPYADLFVAWLDTGEKAVISHDSALALYDLSDVLPGQVHLTVPRTASRRRPGVSLHTNRLTPEEITHRHGLPVTTVARTIADVILSGLGEELVIQAVQEAIARGLVTEETLRQTASQRGGRVARLIEHTLQQGSRSSLFGTGITRPGKGDLESC